MQLDIAFDNDVLIKLARLGLLGNVYTLLGDRAVGVLPTAKWVCRNYIPGHGRAPRELAAFLGQAVALEPSQSELQLSMTIADAAATGNLPIHGGEAILLAIAARRDIPRLVTGDKRAVIAAEQLRDDLDVIGTLDGRLVALEQLGLALQAAVGDAVLYQKVCADTTVDKSLAVCFGCAVGNRDPASHTHALHSYVNDLRRNAPRLLSPTGLAI